MRTVSLPDVLSADTAHLVDASLAREYAVVPLGRSESGRVVLAAASPGAATERLAELEFVLGPVELCAASPGEVHSLLARHYAPEPAGVELPPSFELAGDGEGGAAAFVKSVLSYAARLGASDLHFEPAGGAFTIRLRVDGALRLLPALPGRAGPSVIAALKFMAGLDIGQSRLPQDGRITLSGSDMRLATLPTVQGECAVVRVLDAARRGLDLDSIGMPQPLRRAVETACSRSGLILVCGPTGSGKTTSLHAILRSIGTTTRKVVTVEDPVEYELPGAVQVQARPETGLSFERTLRSFLRHDPDIILVGEIRDAGTARVAMQAALTGHLVLASLHCHDAAQAPLRLTGLGLESWLVGSALELTIAQRLVRRLCPACGGRGCAACAESGFKGRLALFEWLGMTAPLASRLDAADVAGFLREASAGMETTLWKEGLALVESGLTTKGEIAAEIDEA